MGPGWVQGQKDNMLPAAVCRSLGWLCCQLAKAEAFVCCVLTTEMGRGQFVE